MATTTASPPTTTTAAVSSPPLDARGWLSSNQKHAALLDRFETELRLGRLSVSDHQDDRRLVTSRTVALLRTLIGETRWKHPAALIGLLRALGKELHAVGGFREPAIGNVVRRVMAAVREEVNRDEESGNNKKERRGNLANPGK